MRHRKSAAWFPYTVKDSMTFRRQCHLVLLSSLSASFFDALFLLSYFPFDAHRMRQTERRKDMAQAFEQAVRQLPVPWRELLLRIPQQERCGVREICFRAEKPVALMTAGGVSFMARNGSVTAFCPQRDGVMAEEVNRCLRHLTQYSLHAFEAELCGGYLTLQGGHRCGITGHAVYKENTLTHIRDISGISLRIAREIRGIAQPLLQRLYCGEKNPSVLLLGAPGSGKTTLLRDMIRGLADGESGRYLRVAVVDERGELGASLRGKAQNDLGVLSDLLDGFRKDDGMLFALRSLAPQIIAVDEIAAEPDLYAIRKVQHGGAALLASAHASSVADAYRRDGISGLLESGVFDYAVILEGAAFPGKVARIEPLTKEKAGSGCG